MNPFFHIIDRNKILFPPQLLAIKEVITKSTEANGLFCSTRNVLSRGKQVTQKSQ